MTYENSNETMNDGKGTERTQAEYTALREKIGTQAEAARQLGVSSKTISERERGVKTIKPEAWLAIDSLVAQIGSKKA